MKRLFRLAIVFLSAVTVLSISSSCTAKDDPVTDDPADSNLIEVSVEAIKSFELEREDGSTGTRVLTEDGGEGWWEVTASWKAGDKVYVYIKNYDAKSPSELYTQVGVLTAKTDGVKANKPTYGYEVEKTTLGGQLDVDLLRKDPGFPHVSLYCSYKHKLVDGFIYTGQDGTLKSIDDNYDYATCGVGARVDLAGKAIYFSNWMEFRSEQMIMRLTLKDAAGNPIKASKLSVKQTPKAYTNNNDSQGGHGKEARLMPIYALSDMFAYHIYGRYYYYDREKWLSFPEDVRTWNDYHYLDQSHLGSIEVTPSSPTDVLYLALRGNWSSGSIDYAGYLDFTATVGEETYFYRYDGSAFWTNEFVNAEVYMSNDRPSVTNPTVDLMDYTVHRGLRNWAGQTRALVEDGDLLLGPREEGDAVKVYLSDDSMAEVGTLYAQSGGYSAVNLKGDLSGTFFAGDMFLLSYLHGRVFDYTGQKGTLEDIAANYDYSTATIQVTGVDPESNTLSFGRTELRFSQEQCFVRFTLQDSEGNPLNASKLVVRCNVGEGDYLVQSKERTYLGYENISYGPIEVNLDNPSNVIYVALAGSASYGVDRKPLNLTATVGDDTYTCKKENFSFYNSGYYLCNVTMIKPVTDPDVELDASSADRYGQGTEGSL